MTCNTVYIRELYFRNSVQVKKIVFQYICCRKRSHSSSNETNERKREISNYISLGAFFEILADSLQVLKVSDEPLGEPNTGRRVKTSTSISKEGT